MDYRRFGIYLTGFLFLLCSGLLFFSQPDLSVEELVEKNIQAAGGKEKTAQVENFSFKAGSKTYYMSSEGRMKIAEGKEPVVTEVILADSEKVKRNCFNNISEFKGLLKLTYLSLAKLRCGLFTLEKFKDELEFQGLKTFGPRKHYLLTAKINDLEVEFFLDPEEYTIKRIVFKGFVEDQGKYEINHDFGPLQEVNGIKIPSSWFGSQVGARGTLYEISDVKFNQTLDKDFFSKFEVNVGEVKISDGALSGNIVEFMFRRNMLLIGTNWTDENIKKAGFKTKDKLILQISDMEFEIDFYDSEPPRNAISPGAKFMVPNRRSENYLIYFMSQEYKQLTEKLESLLPIQVKRK